VLGANPSAEAQVIITANGYATGTTPGTATVCINPNYVPNTNVCPSFTPSGGSGALEVTISYHARTLFATTMGRTVTNVFGRAVATKSAINNYAVFAGTTTNNKGIDWTGGNDVTVNGRVHSNCDLKITGANK